MYFRDPKKELPKAYNSVFVKTFDNSYCFAYCSSEGKWYPDDGSEVVYPINVVGWMQTEEFDSIEIK